MSELTDLRRAALRLHSREVSPDYQRVQKLLLGRLAAYGATAGQLADKEVDSRKNVALLSAFTKLLPMVPLDFRTNRWDFRTRDPYQARLLMSHIVWSQQVSGGVRLDPKRQSRPGSGTSYPGQVEEEKMAQEASRARFSYRPYVFLGKQGRGFKSVWLLGCIGGDSFYTDTLVRESYGKVFCMEPSHRSRRSLGQLAAMEASEYPSPEEARRLFDLETHSFVVSGEAVGATRVKHKYLTPVPLVQRLTDIEFGQFDVDSRLQSVGAAFGVESELDKLYASQA